MNKYESKTVTKEEQELKDCVCNKCGESILLQHDFISGGNVNISFGYGSIHDGDKCSFELCDKCFDEFMNSLKHKPEMIAYDFFHCSHCIKFLDK